jgi:hypothetical protein
MRFCPIVNTFSSKFFVSNFALPPNIKLPSSPVQPLVRKIIVREKAWMWSRCWRSSTLGWRELAGGTCALEERNGGQHKRLVEDLGVSRRDAGAGSHGRGEKRHRSLRVKRSRNKKQGGDGVASCHRSREASEEGCPGRASSAAADLPGPRTRYLSGSRHHGAGCGHEYPISRFAIRGTLDLLQSEHLSSLRNTAAWANYLESATRDEIDGEEILTTVPCPAAPSTSVWLRPWLVVLATQLGTPRGRYSEHSGKFPHYETKI